VIRTSAEVQGAVSKAEFVTAILAVLTPQSSEGEGSSAAAQIVVTSYETILVHKVLLTGDEVAEYSEGSEKRAALEWGLQQATCGDLAGCSAAVTSLARRRRLQRRVQDDDAAEAITVEFQITADVDVSSNAEPEVLRLNFVQAVTSDAAPSQGLSGLTAADFAVPDPPTITTTIEYTVVLSDTTNMADAAAALRNPANIASSIAEASGSDVVTAVPGELEGSNVPLEATTPTQPPNEEESSDGSGMMIITIAIVVAVVGGGGAYYFLIHAPKQAMNSAGTSRGSSKSAWDNP
jgi:hypothetical protein